MSPRKLEFCRRLAAYLAGDQVSMSIRLEAGDPAAKQWAAIRACTPLFGYPTIEEAEAQLVAWLEEP